MFIQSTKKNEGQLGFMVMWLNLESWKQIYDFGETLFSAKLKVKFAESEGEKAVQRL